MKLTSTKLDGSTSPSKAVSVTLGLPWYRYLVEASIISSAYAKFMYLYPQLRFVIKFYVKTQYRFYGNRRNTRVCFITGISYRNVNDFML